MVEYHIEDDVRKVLLDVKSPKFEDILIEYIGKNYDSYKQNSHNTGEQNIQDFEQFCRLIYTDWYEMMTQNNKSFTGSYKVVSDKLLQENGFKPENIEKMKSDTPFYNFFLRGYDKFFKGSGTSLARLQEGKNLIIDEEGLGGDGFIHVFGYALTGQKPQQIDARLYLNLKAKNIPLFATEMYKKCKEQKMPFYFKFSIQDDRNDPFLLYTQYEYLPKYVAIISDIKNEHPELFDGAERISKNFGVLNGYIGYGEEPKVRDAQNGKYSYNSLRQECINSIRNKIRKDFKQKYDVKNNPFSFSMIPNPMTFDQTCDYLIKKFIDKNLKINAPKSATSEDINKARIILEKALKDNFREEVKKSILTGSQIQNLICRAGEYSGELETSSVDWIAELYDVADIKLSEREEIKGNGTAFRGYLTKYAVFSNKSLNTEEQKLLEIIQRALIKGLKSDLIDPTILKKDALKAYLDKINVPFDKIDKIGEGLLLISAANFIVNGQLRIGKGNNTYVYPELILDIYKDVLGKDNIQEIIEDVCDKKEISSQNICFNKQTEVEIEKTRIDREASLNNKRIVIRK